MTVPAIQLEHVTFQYDSQAEPTLHDVNLTIQPGEKVLIVGPSGSGKSTLGNLINGLIPHAFPGKLSGSVKVNGAEVKDQSLAALSVNVGTVLQDPDAQFVALTAGEDIAFALENSAVAPSEMHARVKKWADRLKIGDLLGQAPQSLSGGQKQRVAMAGVLIDEGDVLLFDEPLASLDPATGEASVALIDELHQAYHVTEVIIEHRLEDVLRRPVDRLVVMADGRILADDTPEHLLRGQLLQKIGLREPLYLEAAEFAGIDLKQAAHLSDAEAFDAPELGSKLAAFTEDAPTVVAEKPQAPLLTVDSLQFAYPKGRQIFTDLNLELHHGEMVALVGRNGVGKSTLSHLIAGFLTPDAGQISLEGKDLADWSVKERADQIGYILQDPNQMISKHLIFDEVALGPRLRGWDEARVNEAVLEALKVCGLYPFRSWPINALSYGQKKRVTIAAILVLEPALMILDEPTAGQDWRHFTDMMRFLTKLNAQGITMMLITHDMHLMLEYAQRAIVLGDGGVLMDATPATVLTDPAVIQHASLAQPSLYRLAKRLGLDPLAFTQAVIDQERRVRQ
ncbi:heme ABC transporter ATP-binding protein [Lacticaseibacillus chiayiensis]|uniref:ABC transporter ATP-binding protein n=1 Tax=Lacticaseibacillus chiayiensis TaxID=2100821 RepID=A0A4Q1U4Y9_9LACO|nr:ABC transporter ATP-binding protein [Lacticaseibacillus chiayiensis]QVI35061.1 ABC transporter ATP-binding protein [Lacticaseibacillus chiayiensis]RXT26574.1 heme ABC transporter ATP-binding protein [Lacticaseibacillus chiayiensis]UYN56843.1 ABC transporter ATP-binding protein [Lacticaseibacillus chiayiensis]